MHCFISGSVQEVENLVAELRNAVLLANCILDSKRENVGIRVKDGRISVSFDHRKEEDDGTC